MSNPPLSRLDRAENRKKIAQDICTMGWNKCRPFEVFRDWVEITAIAFSNAIDRGQYATREARYMQIVKKYNKAELDKFAELLGLLFLDFSGGNQGVHFDDSLGDIFMLCEFGNKYSGQFFTPYSISKLSAQITGSKATIGKLVDEKGFVGVNEPTCGSAGMCIAVAECMHGMGYNYQHCLHITGQEIDLVCLHMSYVQLSILNIPAVLFLGDTLRMDFSQRWVTMAHVNGAWETRLQNAGDKAYDGDKLGSQLSLF